MEKVGFFVTREVMDRAVGIVTLLVEGLPWTDDVTQPRTKFAYLHRRQVVRWLNITREQYVRAVRVARESGWLEVRGRGSAAHLKATPLGTEIVERALAAAKRG
jgi:hypothetical protein